MMKRKMKRKRKNKEFKNSKCDWFVSTIMRKMILGKLVSLVLFGY